MAVKNLEVTLVRSKIACNPKQRATLVGLGLTKRGKIVTVKNQPVFRGMIKKVIHLVTIKEV